jgi:putative selenate reductase
MVVTVDGPFASTHQVIHIDGMCNECGNCGVFCPHQGNPYKDKVTVFWSEADFLDSTNKGFLVVDKANGVCKVRTEDNKVVDYTLGQKDVVSSQMESIIKACLDNYSYVL